MKRTTLIVLVLLLLIAPGVMAQDPTPVPIPTLAAPVQPAADSNVLSILINARTDLELLANDQIGGDRPAGWSGSLDVNDPQLAVLIRLDLELLMARLTGLENIPAGWFGAVPSTAYAIARDIRHDLELLADQMIGLSVRPPGWAGDDAIMRCDRSTQNLTALLQRDNLFVPNVLPTNPNYCQLVAVQIGQYMEANVLANTTQPSIAAAPGTQNTAGASVAGGTATAIADIGLAYLDRHAARRAGMIPVTATFQPVARSFAQFSRMTLVRGEGFEVFVDYKTTTITDEQFLSLPDINTTPANPFCDAAWCARTAS